MDQLSLETEEDLGRLGNIMRRLEVKGMERVELAKVDRDASSVGDHTFREIAHNEEDM